MVPSSVELPGPSTLVQRKEPAGRNDNSGCGLEVVVLFTDDRSTLRAMRTALQLTQGLAARIRLLSLHCVPYPLPLEKPTVEIRFLISRLQRFMATCRMATIDAIGEIRLCRDAWQTLRRVLTPGSVVVIGKRSRWRPTPEDFWARKLRAMGHHVVRTSYSKDFAHV